MMENQGEVEAAAASSTAWFFYVENFDKIWSSELDGCQSGNGEKLATIKHSSLVILNKNDKKLKNLCNEHF